MSHSWPTRVHLVARDTFGVCGARGQRQLITTLLGHVTCNNCLAKIRGGPVRTLHRPGRRRQEAGAR